MSPAGRRAAGERGQVLPVVALALLAGATLTFIVARAAVRLHERMRLQTAADATALAAATAYARGLNVVAATNQLLLAAAVADAAAAALSAGAAAASPASFVDAVMAFQDAWAGTGGVAPGIAPAFMLGAGQAVGELNGFPGEWSFNGTGEAPALNVRRATAGDLIAALTGLSTGGLGPNRVGVPGVRREERYSYQPRGGGARVEVGPQDVEEVRFRRRGRMVTQYRMKTGGGKAGRFVRPEGRVTSVFRMLDLPMPLVESSRVHTVRVSGGSTGAGPVGAAAETAGGEVFNAAWGDPSYQARLVAVARSGSPAP